MKRHMKPYHKTTNRERRDQPRLFSVYHTTNIDGVPRRWKRRVHTLKDAYAQERLYPHTRVRVHNVFSPLPPPRQH